MKKILLALLCVLFCSSGDATQTVDRSDFKYVTPLIRDRTAEFPVRVPLPSPVIAKTRPNYADLRIFDESVKQQVPYVIYRQIQPQRSGKTISWTIKHYKVQGNIQYITLEQTTRTDFSFNNLDIGTPAQDFHKRITISGSDDLKQWTRIKKGHIFDFSSSLALRTTRLEFPERTDRYLQLTITNVDPLNQTEEAFQLKYKDLSFTRAGKSTGSIKIEQFSSGIERVPDDPQDYDHFTITNLEVSQDDRGNTIVSLGYLNLPLEKVTLSVTNPYFYRQVQLWTAHTDRDEEYGLSAHDLIYRIPGVEKDKCILNFHQGRGLYVRLKIIDHDNPPLQLEQVTIHWHRVNLYFFPEKDTSYALYCSSPTVQPPSYDLDRIIPDHYEKLLSYPIWNVESIGPNDLYRQKPDPDSKIMERYLFPALVVLVVLILGYWVYALMKKIPAAPPTP